MMGGGEMKANGRNEGAIAKLIICNLFLVW